MSALKDDLRDLANKSFELGREAGKLEERKEIIEKLAGYLGLTRFSEEHEGAEKNEEWSAGFQAALAIVLSEDK